MVNVVDWLPGANGSVRPLAGRSWPPMRMLAFRAAPTSMRARVFVGSAGERVLAMVTWSVPAPTGRAVIVTGGRGLQACTGSGVTAVVAVVQGGVPQRGQVGQVRLHCRWL